MGGTDRNRKEIFVELELQSNTTFKIPPITLEEEGGILWLLENEELEEEKEEEL